MTSMRAEKVVAGGRQLAASLSRDAFLICGRLPRVQHSEYPTMVFIRRIVMQWGRLIGGGLIVTLLFSQMALAMYACPKQDSAGHFASMQVAGMVLEDAVGTPFMPECHAMPGTMDDEAPHLCRAHCSGDSQPAPSSCGVDLQPLVAHLVWIGYVLPAVIDAPLAADFRARQVQPHSRAGAPPLYLALQVLRN